MFASQELEMILITGKISLYFWVGSNPAQLVDVSVPRLAEHMPYNIPPPAIL